MIIGFLVMASVAGSYLWRRHVIADVVKHGGDFVLTDQDSVAFDTRSLRGRIVFVFFGYSNCPDVCPTTLSKLSSVVRLVGDPGKIVKVVYVSVDPERDRPSVLKADLGNFNLDATGLTGTREQIDSVVAQYGAQYEIVQTPESAGRYTVNHSTTLYLIDRDGKLHTEFPYEASVDEIATVVRKLAGV